ncbi:hypothetical protein [Archangium lansingense]|uniref:Outer membrane protein beta-barrel domain-containing protein n=1 Tax=Archangium lansingense TaxID=2995310 RepID=A0ABT4AAW7_9BACT|nr:hypothetical protein [Archangium lansinium]MCY1078716.1 hypothetical protein [Archangium lansinium]
MVSPQFVVGVTTILVLALLPCPALANPSAHEFSVGAVTSRYDSFIRSTRDHLLLELAYHHRLGNEGFASAVTVGGGLRGGLVNPPENRFVTVPLEVFATVQLRARMGWWEVAAGPEVGVSGFARLMTLPEPFPRAGATDEEQTRLSPVYVGMGVSPLRVNLGHFTASALELRLSTGSLQDSAIRFDIGLLRVGVSL